MKKRSFVFLALGLVLAGFGLWRFWWHTLDGLLDSRPLRAAQATVIQASFAGGEAIHTRHYFDTEDEALLQQLWDILNSTHLQNDSQNLISGQHTVIAHDPNYSITLSLEWGTTEADFAFLSVAGSEYLTVTTGGSGALYHITDPEFTARLAQFLIANSEIQN